MSLVSILLVVISVGSGLTSAYYWYLASKVEISPAWDLEIRGHIDKNIMGWVTGSMIAFTKSGKLNKNAACWTALTVASGAVANFIEVLGKH